MSDIDIERGRSREQVAERERGRGATGMRMITTTETRRSFMTSEFWIAIGMAAAVIVAAYINDGVDIALDQAWALGAAVIGVYVLSRGIAKAGSYDPKIKNLD